MFGDNPDNSVQGNPELSPLRHRGAPPSPSPPAWRWPPCWPGSCCWGRPRQGQVLQGRVAAVWHCGSDDRSSLVSVVIFDQDSPEFLKFVIHGGSGFPFLGVFLLPNYARHIDHPSETLTASTLIITLKYGYKKWKLWITLWLVLLSASVERFFVSRMRDFLDVFYFLN